MSKKIVGYTREEIEAIAATIQPDAEVTQAHINLLNHLNIQFSLHDGAKRTRKMILNAATEIERRGTWA